MKHLLIDFDSKIPNLALMKISAWAKAKGNDTVGLRLERNVYEILSGEDKAHRRPDKRTGQACCRAGRI